MKIRITIDREASISYLVLPVQEESRPVMNERLPGPFAINIDKTPSGEAAGIEIEGVVTEVELVDLTAEVP